MLAALAGCSDNTSPEQTESTADDGKPSFVFVCTGQLGDKSFNDSANSGITEIAESLGCETRLLKSGVTRQNGSQPSKIWQKKENMM